MSKLIVICLSLLATVALLGPKAYAADAGKNDDVFLDEGDGDFDSMPGAKPQADHSAPEAAPIEEQVGAPTEPQSNDETMPPQQAAVPEQQAEPSSPAPHAQAAAPAEPSQAPAHNAAKAKMAKSAKAEKKAAPQAAAEAPSENPATDSATAETSAPAADTAAVEAAEAADAAGATDVAAPATAPTRNTVAHKGKLASGLYVVTQGPCPMKREPASESPLMITVKADKKIWVEEVDANWVRGFNKKGEPGYINRSCVKTQD